MEKKIKGLIVKINIPKSKVFRGFHTIANKDGTYRIFGICDADTNMITTDSFEFVDVFSVKKCKTKKEMSLTKRQISKANTWMKKHKKYIDNMTKNITYGYMPSEEEVNSPELWGAPNWKWFKNNL